MADPPTTLIVTGLSRRERMQLLEQLPSGSAEVRHGELAPGELGEPVTILVVALSVMALTGICGWLSSKGKDVKLSLQVQGPGGLGGGISVEIKGSDTPGDVQARLAEQGVTVPAT